MVIFWQTRQRAFCNMDPRHHNRLLLSRYVYKQNWQQSLNLETSLKTSWTSGQLFETTKCAVQVSLPFVLQPKLRNAGDLWCPSG